MLRTTILAAVAAVLLAGAARADDARPTMCPDNPDAMGTARTIEVDTTGGPDIGTMQYARTLDLAPKEIVFTFDDGPNPEHTPKILDALDRHCIKATFFIVGRYAELHPEIVRETWKRGHTIASHTWSHPILSQMNHWSARKQIDRGFEAARNALAGLTDKDGNEARVAPFFRFPGLNHTKGLRNYLAGQDIATFSCDMGTDDWRSISPWTLYNRALRMIEYEGRGIVIFHDTHYRTSHMLPQILDELARRGYRAVHMVPKGGAPAAMANAEPALPRPQAVYAPRRTVSPPWSSAGETAHQRAIRETLAEADALTARSLSQVTTELRGSVSN